MNGRPTVAVVVALLVVLSGCTSTIGSDPADDGPAGTATEWTVEVVEVVDGDTLKVRFPDGRVENVRLLGVDTPEVHTGVTPDEFDGIPDTEDGRTWLRDWGHQASEWMIQRVADAEIRIATDPEADRRGSYGRLLVYVYADGENVNEELLAQGYARMYDSDFSKRDAFASLEATAMSQDAGLWGYTDGAGAATDDGGAIGDFGLAVASVHADADGPDGDNLNDEYVVLENRGNRTVDLSGYVVRDEANHAYTVPDGVELRPGEELTLFTGSGEDTDDSLYWGASSPIWNNDGDTVFVETPNGTTVVEYEY
ncbi:endonuclease [Halorubellus sp. JP-L1]|uniref:lamin tail domain-containing protein n=1 Tax=Halorubellus sp. JP-L1 TaxID=2715753 RepID=UPI0014082865|nr:lamin tail domain-containing protein [Halorubellus sp. JP-L1]NHN43272.1 endonuclease [Halorubellus sp. JP-L1]